jgi:hypothetical protein
MYNEGKIELPLGLHLTNSIQIFGNSDLSITLTTNPPGSPVNPKTFGPVTLVGSGIIQGGMLGGRQCDLTVTGLDFVREH